jgi:hypothetical protein
VVDFQDSLLKICCHCLCVREFSLVVVIQNLVTKDLLPFLVYARVYI